MVCKNSQKNYSDNGQKGDLNTVSIHSSIVIALEIVSSGLSKKMQPVDL